MARVVWPCRLWRTIETVGEDDEIVFRLSKQLTFVVALCSVVLYGIVFAVAVVVNRTIPIALGFLFSVLLLIIFIQYVPLFPMHSAHQKRSTPHFVAGMIYVPFAYSFIMLLILILLVISKSRLRIEPNLSFSLLSAIAMNTCFVSGLWMFNEVKSSPTAKRFIKRWALWVSGLLTICFYGFLAVYDITESSLVDPATREAWLFSDWNLIIMTLGMLVNIWFTINLANRQGVYQPINHTAICGGGSANYLYKFHPITRGSLKFYNYSVRRQATPRHQTHHNNHRSLAHRHGRTS